MKVLVVGSCRTLGEQEKDDFRKACEELGVALVRKGHTLIMCSLSERTADRHVLVGANTVEGSHKVLLFRPDPDIASVDPETIQDPGSSLTLQNLNIETEEPNGGWRVVHLQAIRNADLVIAISGDSRGTGTLIYSAEALEKAVIVVPGFGGVAAEAWRDFKRFYTSQEQGILRRVWAPGDGWGERLVAMAEGFARRNPMATSSPWASLLGSIVTALILVASWIVVLQVFDPLRYKLGWIAVLTAVAANAGLLLRQSLRSGLYRPRDRLSHLLQAVLLSFAIIMVGEIANIFLSGKALTLENSSEVTSLGWRLSIAGFAAGFLGEEYTKLLENRAQKILSSM